jgi:vacuolar-type H+-ATPase subunit F/Vma7
MPDELIKENALAIIGEEDVVLGFRALGFKAYAVKKPEDSQIALDDCVVNSAAICLVQEDIYQKEEGQIKNYKNLAFPIFIPFSKDAKASLLDALVRDIRLRATGTFRTES